MNQPTREEFETFKQEIRQEVRQQIREQITEEIKVTRVEIVSEDALKRLESIDNKLGEHSKLLKSLDQKFIEQNEHLKRIDQKQDEHAKALVAHSKSISALQTSVEALPTEERVEALLIKYLRPSTNGH